MRLLFPTHPARLCPQACEVASITCENLIADAKVGLLLAGEHAFLSARRGKADRPDLGHAARLPVQEVNVGVDRVKLEPLVGIELTFQLVPPAVYAWLRELGDSGWRYRSLPDSTSGDR